MRLSDDFLLRLKESNDIYEIMSSYVPLKKAGSDYVCNCPFHSEKTPSCHVYMATQSFYCFGCGAAGDVINFIRLYENLDYMEAVRFLAQRSGIAMPEDGGEDASKARMRLLEMNREAGKFFHKTLFSPLGKEGLDYFLQRGVSEHIIRVYGLGFAPDSWSELKNHMNNMGFSDNELVAGSLLQQGNKNAYDYFRRRVMFPFFDVRGNIVGFSGRVVDPDSEDKRKYLNSRDTLIYNKSKFLYSMNHAKNTKSQELILCEGNLDVISLYQYGFKNAIATCGTAITDNHARIMSNLGFKNVTIAYDSDAPGQKATEKAMGILSNVGINSKILKISGAKDPDEYLKKYGAEAFGILLEKSESSMDYELARMLESVDINTTQGKTDYLKKCVSFLAGVPSSIDRAVYISEISAKCGVNSKNIEDAVTQEIRKRQSNKTRDERRNILSGANRRDKINPEAYKFPLETQAERGIIAFLMHSPEYLKRISDSIGEEYFVTEFNKRLFTFIVSEINKGGVLDIGSFGNDFSADEVSEVMRIVHNGNELPYSTDRLNDYIKILTEYHQKNNSKSIQDMSEEEMREYINKLKNKKS